MSAHITDRYVTTFYTGNWSSSRNSPKNTWTASLHVNGAIVQRTTGHATREAAERALAKDGGAA